MSDIFSRIDVQQLKDLREENIGRQLLHAHRDFSTRAYEKLHKRGHTGLTLNHSALLANLDLDGTRITVIAERAGMTKQSMGELAQDLEKKGYIERTTDPTDRRATIIKFTEAGCRYLIDAYEIKCEIEKEYAALIGVEGIAHLREMLKIMANSRHE